MPNMHIEPPRELALNEVATQKANTGPSITELAKPKSESLARP